MGIVKSHQTSYPITSGETAAGVAPVNISYPELTVDRYGRNTTPGTTDMTTAIQNAINVASQEGGGTVTALAATYLFTNITRKQGVTLVGQSITATTFTTNTLADGMRLGNPVNTSTGSRTADRDYTLTCTNTSNTGGGWVDITGSDFVVNRIIVNGFKYSFIFDQSESADLDTCQMQNPLTGGLWLCNGSDHTPGVTFTAGPAASATSGTLTGNWTNTTGYYNLNFVETAGGASESRNALLTNASTAVTWINGLNAACNAATTAANTGFTNRVGAMRCEFNAGTTSGYAIIDDGGAAHIFRANNFAGFANQIYVAGVRTLAIVDSEFETAGLGNIINATSVTFNTATSVGTSGQVTIQNNYLSPGSTAITFTSAPAAAATSGTLTANWTGATGRYNLVFVETVGGAFEVRTALMTNGSTAVTWITGLTNACNAATKVGCVYTSTSAGTTSLTLMNNRTITSTPTIIGTANMNTVFACGNQDSNVGVLFDGIANTHFEMGVTNAAIKIAPGIIANPIGATTCVAIGQAAASDSVLQVAGAGATAGVGLRVGYNNTAFSYYDSGTHIIRDTVGGVQLQIPSTGALQSPRSPLASTTTQVLTGLNFDAASDTNYTSNATLTNDAIIVTVNETGTYEIECFLAFYEATASTGGFQFDFGQGTATVGSILFQTDAFGTAILGNAAATSKTTAQTFATIATSASAPSWAFTKGKMTINVAGTFGLRTAQNTSSANTTTRKSLSYLKLTKTG